MMLAAASGAAAAAAAAICRAVVLWQQVMGSPADVVRLKRENGCNVEGNALVWKVERVVQNKASRW